MTPVSRVKSQVGSQYSGDPLESAQEWLLLSCCQMTLLWGPAGSPVVLNVFLNTLTRKERFEMKSTTDLRRSSWNRDLPLQEHQSDSHRCLCGTADEHSCWYVGCSSDHQLLVGRDQLNLVHSAPGLSSYFLVIHPILTPLAAYSNTLCSWRYANCLPEK